jgi:hypothetical protein
MPEEDKEKIYKMAADSKRTLEFYQAYKKPNSYSLNIRRVDFDTAKLEWFEK